MKLIKQHAAAAVLTIAAYMFIAGCDFGTALANTSMYIMILIMVISADITAEERRRR